jgi:ssDNA-binding Zn-finger/Zn-ribbon topoisomerase 1
MSRRQHGQWKKNVARRAKMETNAQRNYIAMVTRQVLDERIAPMCKWCRIRLTRRKGKYGLFWGCKNWPACAFTLPLKRTLQ